jgi:tRNA 2-selenouridine synthase
MKKIRIDEFITLAQQLPVIDVRSPGEFAHANIPGAYSLPLFSDEERKIVGTAYIQQGRKQAIKIGLDFFGPKMRPMVEAVEQIIDKHCQLPTANCQLTKTVLVHCWRGGMRSGGVAWLLDLYGFRVFTLVGGYKAYRNWALAQFDQPYPFKVIGGYTGSGKTPVLHQLKNQGHAVIDLEKIAHHKGSAFGDLGETKPPTAEMFENELALALYGVKDSPAIWIEDESQRIGNVNLPNALWKTMRRSPVFFLEIPFEERLKYITAEYGKFQKEDLVKATVRIQKRLGSAATKNALAHFAEDNFAEAFRILLTYYDKYYFKGLHEREKLEELLTILTCSTVATDANAELMLSSFKTKLSGSSKELTT